MMNTPNLWNPESPLYDLERSIDTLSKISDGLPDDRETANAISVVITQLCEVYSTFKTHFEA